MSKVTKSLAQSCPFDCQAELTLCGDDAIEFKGVRYQPDETKGYFQFSVIHAFPNSNAYGTAIHPHVADISHESLLHQNVNKEHQIKAYHPKGSAVKDSVIGSILAVDFPRPKFGNKWAVTAMEFAPAVTGVAVYHKQLEGIPTFVGEHVTRKQTRTVSIEINYDFLACGFAVGRAGGQALKEFRDTTPEDMAMAGFDYHPVQGASDELLATFSKTKRRIAAKYKGRTVNLLMGGLDTPVHCQGLAVVRYGAESTAEILRLAASRDVEHPAIAALSQLADTFSEAARAANQPKCGR